MRRLLSRVRRSVSWLFLLPIYLYQRCISPMLGPSCRFTPTCSQYAVEAIKRHGPLYGLYLTVRRLLRCHPWGGSGYDPVPSNDLPIDIHTHALRPVAGEAILSVSLSAQESEYTASNYAGWYSAGVHPWFIEKAMPLNLENNNRLLAIGEAGLDKCARSPLTLQTEMFELQARLAEELHKPLIIHLVRATDELLAIRSRLRPTQAWIIHGFRGKPTQAEQLLKQGFYLSFGEKYNEESLRLTPIDRLFLETDESLVPIRELYRAAAVIRGVSYEELLESVRENVRRVFFHS